MDDTPGGEQVPQVMASQALFQERPQVKIVRSSGRRKFLVGALGGVAILAVGSMGFEQIAQDLHTAFNVKNYPYHFWDDLVGEDFSPDLNLMSMVKVSEMDNQDAKLYIWDYQRQHMITLATGPSYGSPACIWSPNNRYFVYQSHKSNDTLELWDMRSYRKIRSYAGNDYSGFSKIHYSPDGSKLGLLVNNGNAYLFVVMDAMQLTPLLTFNAPNGAAQFTWSPDGRKVAFLLDDSQNSHTWEIQIWDCLARQMEMNASFDDIYTESAPSELYWSHTGQQIVVLVRKKIYILQTTDAITHYNLSGTYPSALIAWSPDSKYLAVNTWQSGSGTSSSNALNVWDITRRKITRSYDRGDDADTKALAWSRDGRHITVIGGLYNQENWDWP